MPPDPVRAPGGWWVPTPAGGWEWRADGAAAPRKRRRRWPWAAVALLAAVGAGIVARDELRDLIPDRPPRAAADTAGIGETVGWNDMDPLGRVAMCQSFKRDPSSVIDLMRAGRALDRGEVEAFLRETC